jgi:hypothetical protein
MHKRCAGAPAPEWHSWVPTEPSQEGVRLSSFSRKRRCDTRLTVENSTDNQECHVNSGLSEPSPAACGGRSGCFGLGSAAHLTNKTRKNRARLTEF